MLKEGDKAPIFIGVDQFGKKISSAYYKGRKMILYFYPKDNLPTCSIESRNLQNNITQLVEKGFVVIGVSADSQKSHQKFSKKLQLSYSLIADTGKKIIKDFGVWGSRSLFGINYEGILRTTFIIDEAGTIQKIFTKIKANDHTRQILSALETNVQLFNRFLVL